MSSGLLSVTAWDGRNKAMPKRLLDGLWCLALCAYILAGAALVPFHGDESTQIYMGRDFFYALNGQSVALQAFESLDGQAATQQQLRLINGTLPKYFFGAITYFQGYSIEQINEQWAWGSGWQWNHENGHVPPENLLWGGRLFSSLMLSVASLAMFGIGYQVSGRLVAYLASALFTLNPAILINGRRAMMEGSMLAFTLLAVFVALYLLKNRAWWLYVLLGLFSGLAVASKHTSVMTIAGVFLATGLYFLSKKFSYRSILGLVLAGILSLATFYALNPAWWNQPIETAKMVLQLRQQLLNEQVSSFSGYANLGEQALGFGRQVFILQPMYSEVEIDGFLSEQAEVIRAYEASGLAGLSFGLLGAVFSFIGIVALWRMGNASAWLIAVWALAMLVLTLLLTPLEWQRYYLPIYPVMSLLTALGLEFALTLIPRKSE
jgi:hypothetical protein